MGGLMQCATRVVCVGLMQLMDGIEVPGGVEVDHLQKVVAVVGGV
jgi:hypothetical protein